MDITTSAEKLENVERPPRKPVIMNNRHGANDGINKKTAIATPIKYPAIQFAAKVPNGIHGNKALRDNPNHQRNKHPSAPPTLIMIIELNISYPSYK